MPRRPAVREVCMVTSVLSTRQTPILPFSSRALPHFVKCEITCSPVAQRSPQITCELQLRIGCVRGGRTAHVHGLSSWRPQASFRGPCGPTGAYSVITTDTNTWGVCPSQPPRISRVTVHRMPASPLAGSEPAPEDGPRTGPPQVPGFACVRTLTCGPARGASCLLYGREPWERRPRSGVRSV